MKQLNKEELPSENIGREKPKIKTRPRDFFKTFRPFLNTKGNAKNGEIKLIVDGRLVRDQKLVAEVLVNHFATLADDIGGTGAQLSSTDDFDNHPSIQRIRQERKDFTTISDVTPVTQGQVKTVLESLDTNKATGCDGIPAKIMRIGAEELSQPLADLFNSCIRNRVWPSDWKRGVWTPIYKKEDKCSKENYRPITVLPCVDKVFEQLIGLQVSTAFQANIYEQSSAYRKAHSCETTLINLVEEWKRARDSRLDVAILSTDMSKAFDSLHPPLLLSKLKAYGFQEGMIQLLNSYLCDRKYRVKTGSHTSSSRMISRGCPQGSALGPLMWNIFQNDLCLFDKSSLSMYADDHQMFHVGNDRSNVTLELRETARNATNTNHHATYAELLKRAQLPTLKNRRLQDACTLMYKVKHKTCPA